MKLDISSVYQYKWVDLYYIKFDNKIGFDAYRSLCTNQEESLKLTKAKFVDKLKNDEFLNFLEPAHQGGYLRLFEREELIIKEVERQQRYSIILSIFSFFEGRLKSICNKIESTFNFKIKIDDLNKNEYLMRYWNYLEKVYEIDSKSLIPFFTPIKQHKIIRNILAHQAGILKKEQKKKIVEQSGLEIKKIGNDFQIELKDSTFILYLIDVMDAFFNKLLLAIDKRYEKNSFTQKKSN